MTAPVQSATPEELPEIRKLLDEAELPHADLIEGTPVRFWVAREGTAVIGAVGLETFGPAGLLRSLVVAPRARGRGLGAQLVQAVEHAAAAEGLHQLVLLTQTAEPFFTRRDYTVIDRARAPAELRDSSEFRSLCPASATCMQKQIA